MISYYAVKQPNTDGMLLYTTLKQAFRTWQTDPETRILRVSVSAVTDVTPRES